MPISPSLRLNERFLELYVQDLPAAQAAISRRYCSYRVRHATTDTTSPIVLHSAVSGAVTLSTLTFGRDIEIEPEDLDSCLLITTTMKGHTELATHHTRYGGGPGTTAVSVAADQPRFHYTPAGEVLKVQLDSRRVSAVCWRLMQRQGQQALRFNTQMTDPEALRRWLMLLDFVVSTLNDSDMALRTSLAPSIEEMLTLTLLDIQAHNYSDALRSPITNITPKQLRLAIDFMEAHFEQALTLSQIADEANCSIRSLSRAFQQFRQTTPMQHLNELRLQKVHEELLNTASSTQSIAALALQHGFSHLSSFNQQYRRRYAESPSQTRARAHDGTV